MKVIFLDRDGVINVDTGHLYKIGDWKFTSNCVKALKSFVKKGFEIIVITNQAGIAKGYYSVHDYNVLTDWYVNYLANKDVPILDVFYCPHHPEGNIDEFSVSCNCRKPKPGLIESAFVKYDIDIANSFLVGDKISDIRAGSEAGLENLVLLDSEYFSEEESSALKEKHLRFKNLYDFSLNLV
ncbi:MAG: HAD family hydrolase [Gammaproteobacteria bacterium]|nr:HAD family hydrolase [Gammaproteobacteria bacterium]